MAASVHLQVPERAVAAPTRVAAERLIVGVQLQVSLENVAAGEALPTRVTGVHSLLIVGQQVALQ